MHCSPLSRGVLERVSSTTTESAAKVPADIRAMPPKNTTPAMRPKSRVQSSKVPLKNRLRPSLRCRIRSSSLSIGEGAVGSCGTSAAAVTVAGDEEGLIALPPLGGRGCLVHRRNQSRRVAKAAPRSTTTAISAPKPGSISAVANDSEVYWSAQVSYSST